MISPEPRVCAFSKFLPPEAGQGGGAAPRFALLPSLEPLRSAQLLQEKRLLSRWCTCKKARVSSQKRPFACRARSAVLAAAWAGGHGATLPSLAGDREELLLWWGWREPWSLFGFLLQGFTLGQAPRVVPGYLELSFLSVKKERTEPSHEGVVEYPELEGSHKNQRVQVEGRCCLRAVLLRACASCSSAHLSSDKRELTR